MEETKKGAIVDELVRENAGLRRRIADLERENNRLANLHIALKQIYASLDFDEAVRAIVEVIINCLGVARFTLLITDDSKSVLTPIASVGMEDEPVRVGEGVVGRAAETSEAFWAAAGEGAGIPGAQFGVGVPDDASSGCQTRALSQGRALGAKSPPRRDPAETPFTGGRRYRDLLLLPAEEGVERS